MESAVKYRKNKAELLLLLQTVVVVPEHYHASHVAKEVYQVLKLSGFPSYLLSRTLLE
jgi:hypothetical protein